MNKDYVFLNHWPRTFNVGDFLLNPILYFDFGIKIYKKFIEKNNNFDETKLIIGGGAYLDLGVKKVKEISPKVSVSWSIGRSSNFNINNDKIESIVTSAEETYDFCGSRDIENTKGKIDFVPCVSVFNDIVDLPIGTKTGIFLNGNIKRTDSKIMEKYLELSRKNEEIIFSLNSFSEIEIKKMFSQTKHIITNSYHMAYWGLLSGRAVSIIGYSSKFTSLLNIFEKDESYLLRYDKNNLSDLEKLIDMSISKKTFLNLSNPHKFKERFKDLNFNFANKLVQNGVVPEAKLIDQNFNSLLKRNNEIKKYYELYNKKKVVFESNLFKNKFKRKIKSIIKDKPIIDKFARYIYKQIKF